MIKKIIFLMSAFVLFVSSITVACTYNGQEYPEGTIIGPYICTGGNWVQR